MSFPKEENLVSFIIPFVDELNYLQEAVASCILQGLRNDEIIVVCNHHTMIGDDQKKRLFKQSENYLGP